jgi:hypothetical protein
LKLKNYGGERVFFVRSGPRRKNASPFIGRTREVAIVALGAGGDEEYVHPGYWEVATEILGGPDVKTIAPHG